MDAAESSPPCRARLSLQAVGMSGAQLERLPSHTAITEASVDAQQSTEVPAIAGYCLDMRLCCSCRYFKSAASPGFRQRTFRNRHMPAPAGSSDILTALRSRKRTNSRLCSGLACSCSARRNSASEIPLRFALEELWSRATPGQQRASAA